jgi:hypothetical protein
MIITATDEGREFAQAGIDSNWVFDMFEDWIENGWIFIRPDDIGALTDGEIISPDAYYEDDGTVNLPPGARIYVFFDYQVVDPRQNWSEGKGVIFDVSEVSSLSNKVHLKVSNPASDLKKRLLR